jgi:hypothetical protein
LGRWSATEATGLRHALQTKKTPLPAAAGARQIRKPASFGKCSPRVGGAARCKAQTASLAAALLGGGEWKGHSV